MRMLWATRGKSWGVRFLRSEPGIDPLPVYDRAFSGTEEEQEVWRRVGNLGALRFHDPEGRLDSAGRTILHEFVVFAPEADEIDSVEDGRQRVWAEVANEYERVWNMEQPDL